jgi:L-ascorbate metabolism protein UlaG (beta-lactamase superfamily)
MAKITWHGHATCTLVTDDGTTVVIDPFFGDNPSFEGTVDDVPDADYILCSHGHFDHFADCIPLAKRTGATVVSTFEIVSFCQKNGVENGHGMNIGGGHRFPFGYVKMTPAIHSGTVAGDDEGAFTTTCGGFLIDLGEKTLYHSGDTALTRDMELLRGEVDVALLPIGDNFTMGPRDAARAVAMIEPGVVIPIHYSTWPVIEQDPEEFRRLVGDKARVEILSPGDSYEI